MRKRKQILRRRTVRAPRLLDYDQVRLVFCLVPAIIMRESLVAWKIVVSRITAFSCCFAIVHISGNLKGDLIEHIDHAHRII